MLPVPSARGRPALAASALLVASGLLAPEAAPLAALGVLLFAAFGAAYLHFAAVAVLLHRRKIELAWWVPLGELAGGALAVDLPFAIHLAAKNRGSRALRFAGIELLGSTGLDLASVSAARIPASSEVELVAPARARACGHLMLHGAVITFIDPCGLFELRAFFPNPLALTVFPRAVIARGRRARQSPRVGAPHEKAGPHEVRALGPAGNLRELRDHVPGDPFKLVAWKATARKRRLVVRELENEIVVTYQLLVDLAATMRDGLPGRAPLDRAIDTAAGLARVALDGGDRVGLTTFDTRIHSQLGPSDGRPQWLKVLDRLLETRNVVDEDLTDVTDGELVAAVARYLGPQEGFDARVKVAPAPDDPRWERLAPGPAGELYDGDSLLAAVEALLGVHEVEASRAKASRWSAVKTRDGAPAAHARLRLFCRLRGIELPQRRAGGLERSRGLAEAVGRARLAERAQFLVVVTDLGWLDGDPRPALDALARARAQRQQVVLLAVAGAAPGAASLVADTLALAARVRLARARRLLVRHGIPLLVANPDEPPTALLARIARTRGSRALRRSA
ncbi:MAG: DUF58 domain-containing protein [Myxococcales bacterium]|nr:DUF58 domain-containing protein [Myxococcales bacterium]